MGESTATSAGTGDAVPPCRVEATGTPHRPARADRRAPGGRRPGLGHQAAHGVAHRMRRSMPSSPRKSATSAGTSSRMSRASGWLEPNPGRSMAVTRNALDSAGRLRSHHLLRAGEAMDRTSGGPSPACEATTGPCRTAASGYPSAGVRKTRARPGSRVVDDRPIRHPAPDDVRQLLGVRVVDRVRGAVDRHRRDVRQAGRTPLDPPLADERVAAAEDDERRDVQLGDALGRRVVEHRADKVERGDRP